MTLKALSEWQQPHSFWRPLSSDTNVAHQLPISVELYGHQHWADRVVARRGIATNASIELVTSGSLLYTQDDVIHEAQRNELYCLRPGTSQEQRTGHAGHCTKRFIVLTGPALPAILESLGDVKDGPIALKDPARVRKLFRELWALRSRPGPSQVMRASCIAYEILAYGAESRRNSPPRRLKPVMKRLECEEPWPTLQELAEIAGLSVSQFSRVFRKHVGKSPRDYVLHMRMRRAASYLHTTDWPVGRIACQLGYETPYYFTHQFTKHYGMPPTAYREGSSAGGGRL